MAPKVLVIGATGQLGSLLVSHLQGKAEIELVIPTRYKEKMAALRKIHPAVVYLDLDKPNTFADALTGVERLFLLTGYSVAMVTQSKTIIDAALKAGVKHIVHVGVFSPEWDCTVPHFTWHQMIEVYIKSSPIKWTFLHPNCFLQNMTSFSVINNNQFNWYTTKPCGWVALEDVSECAAKILSEGHGLHHGKDYWFSTESLDIYQVAKTLSEIFHTNIAANPRLASQFIPDMGKDPATIDPYFF